MCDHVTEGWVDDAVRELAGHYDEPHRTYHTRRHVTEVLAALRDQPGTSPLHPALTLAAWSHDVVYDPRSLPGGNEHASGELAREVLTRVGAHDDLIDEVVGHTLDTAAHAISEGLAPAIYERRKAFLDADLWILSAQPPRYQEYCHQVRQEYAHVPDQVFRVGRADILQSLMARDHLYLCEHHRRHWEPRARANLTRELERLRMADGR